MMGHDRLGLARLLKSSDLCSRIWNARFCKDSEAAEEMRVMGKI